MKSAVIVIDMLNEFVHGKRDEILIWPAQKKKLIPNIHTLIDIAHRKGVPVVYSNCFHTKTHPCVKIVGEHAMRGTKGAQIIPELKPTKKLYQAVQLFTSFRLRQRTMNFQIV